MQFIADGRSAASPNITKLLTAVCPFIQLFLARFAQTVLQFYWQSFNPSTGSRGQIDPRHYKLFNIKKWF